MGTRYWVMQERHFHKKWLPFLVTKGDIRAVLPLFERHALERGISNQDWRATPFDREALECDDSP